MENFFPRVTTTRYNGEDGLKTKQVKKTKGVTLEAEHGKPQNWLQWAYSFSQISKRKNIKSVYLHILDQIKL